MSDVLPFNNDREKRGPGELGHRLPGVITADMIGDLRDRKLLQEQEETIELDEVALGERTTGYLTKEERIVYIETVRLATELEEHSREMTARSHETLADAIRKTKSGENIFKNIDDKILFPTKEDAEHYYGMLTRLEYLRAVFHQSIRERYGHSDILGVRSGFAVVRVRSKYELPAELIEHFDR